MAAPWAIPTDQLEMRDLIQAVRMEDSRRGLALIRAEAVTRRYTRFARGDTLAARAHVRP